MPGMDPVANLLGGSRSMAYKVEIVDAVGSLTAGVLLSLFWIWTSTLDDVRDGWFWKTREDIRRETGLTRYEQEGARKKLVELGVLQEELRGLPAKMWYRIDLEKLDELLRKHLATKLGEIPPTRRGKSRQQAGGETASSMGENPPAIYADTETQAETRTETAATSRTREVVPDLFAAANSDVRKTSEKITSPLVAELIEAGVSRAVATDLARDHTEECRRQLGYLPFVDDIKRGRGAYLASAIRGGYGPPPRWEQDQAEQRKREQEQRAAHARQAKEQRHLQQDQAREAQIAAVRAQLEADPEKWAGVLAEAEKRLPAPLRGRPDRVAYRPALEAKIVEIVAAGLV